MTTEEIELNNKLKSFNDPENDNSITEKDLLFKLNEENKFLTQENYDIHMEETI